MRLRKLVELIMLRSDYVKGFGAGCEAARREVTPHLDSAAADYQRRVEILNGIYSGQLSQLRADLKVALDREVEQAVRATTAEDALQAAMLKIAGAIRDAEAMT